MLIIITFLLDIGSTDRVILGWGVWGMNHVASSHWSCDLQIFVLFCSMLIFYLDVCIWCLHASPSEWISPWFEITFEFSSLSLKLQFLPCRFYASFPFCHSRLDARLNSGHPLTDPLSLRANHIFSPSYPNKDACSVIPQVPPFPVFQFMCHGYASPVL